LALLVLLFSLAGVPPMLGFFAKFGVWQAGVDAGLIWLVAASAVASAIGAYYYLRIVFLMYFGEEGDDRLDGGKSGLLTGFLIASAVIMVVGIANMFGVEGAAITAAATLVN
jgi:NADH-quinone oxidoreductase subunit N